ncbi:hypothetical protein NEPAR06_0263 [Nematocida parisii]|uniref:GATA-type domain-containing protein n=1 Tax=Nematocida parisii (strain ERTm3) TaxID=935791 RepID=I3EJ04_NEMP3|nr:uncharacterized protein NEPG_01591 [Nematocida parisii ERTm1]EIJ89201.1 hypothetical protein NEQG_01020 [Nematocida parisii ERTm3]KAI5126402.1 hypothetical protein NEPAR03_0483 [Nematocida parisii]EIJ93249.1 hypothetical protein NEPG_01591 [Nematocida parisii ERTm1]KAI5126481.1 hypothetical protein NEPAR08_0472 [Nematocida parisii]KAI5140694.1 hypothetical protein NEPAR04_0429 [Nematocida parisii]|eukprot:XP_013059419.1 hypothetical protein NEPG_01591 [Nematocida parisii ERTm1]
MNEKKIRGTVDQNKLRHKIEMRYKAPEKVKYESPAPPINRSIEIKKVLIRHYMDTMQSKRINLDESHKVCGFCHTKETSLWRRIGDIIVCNACGLYYRIHGKIRNKNLTRGRKTKQSAEKNKENEYTENDSVEE